MNDTRIPAFARLLLSLRYFGKGRSEQRSDIESDLAELFAMRAREHGRLHAWLRLWLDLVSVSMPRPRAGVLAQDLRYGLRLFARHPALIGTTVAGLALAIAVATTVFSILNSFAFRPYDIDDPAATFRVQRLHKTGMSTQWPYALFTELHNRAVLANVEAAQGGTLQISASPDVDRSQRERVMTVSGGYLALLGGRAMIGRTLGPDDDRAGAPTAIVLSHFYWTRALNSDASVVGRTMWLGGVPVQVVGVLRPRFAGIEDKAPAAWFTFAASQAIYHYDKPLDRTSRLPVDVVARTSPASSTEAAQSQLSNAAVTLPASGLDEFDAGKYDISGVRLDAAGSRIDTAHDPMAYAVIAIVFVVIALVLALACSNVANLLLAGASTREREIGVRLAMGATLSRIRRQLITESALIGIIAGGLGLLLSVWTMPALAAAIDLPETQNVSPDWSVLTFAIVIALASGIGAGLAPARYAVGGDVVTAMKSGGAQSSAAPRGARMRRWFIGVQAAASILLLVVAALFTRAAVNLTRLDLGFDADKVVAAHAAFPGPSFVDTAASAYWHTAAERAAAIPGVEGASLALFAPLAGEIAVTNLTHNGAPYSVYENRTDANYFSVTGIRVIRGRGYTADEARANAPVVVITEQLVRDFLSGRDPIGAPLSAITGSASNATVIGVIAEATTWRVHDMRYGTVYRPLDPNKAAAARLIMRTPQPASAAARIESALAAIDPRVRITATPVSRSVEQYLREPRLIAGAAIAVAALALLLAVVGLYGVTAFVVKQRMAEMSVRVAIGAAASDIMRLLIGDSLRPVVIGLAVGLTGALLSTQVLSVVLFGVSPRDPLSVIGAVAVLLAAGLSAVIVPARQAARIDPARVLRNQ